MFNYESSQIVSTKVTSTIFDYIVSWLTDHGYDLVISNRSNVNPDSLHSAYCTYAVLKISDENYLGISIRHYNSAYDTFYYGCLSDISKLTGQETALGYSTFNSYMTYYSSCAVNYSYSKCIYEDTERNQLFILESSQASSYAGGLAIIKNDNKLCFISYINQYNSTSYDHVCSVFMNGSMYNRYLTRYGGYYCNSQYHTVNILLSNTMLYRSLTSNYIGGLAEEEPIFTLDNVYQFAPSYSNRDAYLHLFTLANGKTYFRIGFDLCVEVGV